MKSKAKRITSKKIKYLTVEKGIILNLKLEDLIEDHEYAFELGEQIISIKKLYDYLRIQISEFEDVI